MVERFYGPLTGFEMRPGKRGDYVLYSDYAKLAAENERLREQITKATDPTYLEEKLRQIGITDEIAERALVNRAGGAKVRELLDEGLEILNGIIDNVKRRGNYSPESTCVFIDQAGQCFREALAALTTEPTPPEGQQEPVAFMDAEGNVSVADGSPLPAMLRSLPDAPIGKPLLALYAHPPAQAGAVTEAMVEAVVQAVRPYTMRTLFIDEHRELVRTALSAALAQEGK